MESTRSRLKWESTDRYYSRTRHRMFVYMSKMRVLRRLHFFLPSPNTQFIVITLMDPVCFFSSTPSHRFVWCVCVLILCTVSTYNGSRKYMYTNTRKYKLGQTIHSALCKQLWPVKLHGKNV